MEEPSETADMRMVITRFVTWDLQIIRIKSDCHQTSGRQMGARAEISTTRGKY
jgi:hypothetical protein